MSETKRHYELARDAWIRAREEFKRSLNDQARQMQVIEHMGDSDRGYEYQFNNAYSMYQAATDRYLHALKVYTRERPDLTGRLMYITLQEAANAQMTNRNDASNRYLKSAEKLAIESVKVAYADWIKNGKRDTMAAVFVSIADAQVLNVDHDLEVSAIAQEVFDHFRQGKVKREPRTKPVQQGSRIEPVQQSTKTEPIEQESETQTSISTPKVPSAKKRRPGPSLWIRKVIPY